MAGRSGSVEQRVRVLHEPYDIAGDPMTTVDAERELGMESYLATIRGEGEGDFRLDWSFGRPSPIGRQTAKLRQTLRALRYFDAIVFEYGSGAIDYPEIGLDLLDVRLAHRLGKTVAVIFHGSDLRETRPDLFPYYLEIGAKPERARRRLKIAERNADLLYVKTPDLIALLPHAAWLPAAVSGLGAEPAPPRPSGPLKVVHAPSNRQLKGTDALLRAVDGLRSEGREVDLLLIEGLPREEARRLYRMADVAVDQLRVGWYGVFAVEMMAIGKPVVCHIDPRALEASGLQNLPIVDADEHTIGSVLAELDDDRQGLAALGEEGLRYVRRIHDPASVASKLAFDLITVCERKRETAALSCH